MLDLSSADKLTVIPENLEILEGFFFNATNSCKNILVNFFQALQVKNMSVLLSFLA